MRNPVRRPTPGLFRGWANGEDATAGGAPQFNTLQWVILR
jgi:hypothetical protein